VTAEGTEPQPEASGGRKRLRLDWKAVVGIIVSVGFLYFTLRDVAFGEVLAEVGRSHTGLLLLSVAVNYLVFPLRAVRWKALLEPVRKETGFRSRYAATAIGFMANNVLPARVGEFARAYALSRLEPVRTTASFGSLVVERLFDAITVVASLVIALAWPTFPSNAGGGHFASVARTLVVALAGVVLVLSIMVWKPVGSVRFFEAVAGRILPPAIRRVVVDVLEAFLAGLGAVRSPALVLRIAFWSIMVWTVNALSFWIGFQAFGIDISFVAALFLQSVIGLAVSLPSAPGFFGLWEAGARVGLVQVYGIAASPAVAFALGFHFATFVPVTVVGLWYVGRLGISWSEVGASEEVVEEAVEMDGRSENDDGHEDDTGHQGRRPDHAAP
jgi:uncharacterized protein (TIRG00374 family)